MIKKINKSTIKQTINIKGDNYAPIYQTIQIGDSKIANSLPRLPLPVEAYVGHEDELREVYDLFRNGKKMIILTGLGGIGKTEFSKYFGNKYFQGKGYYLNFKQSFANTFLDYMQLYSPNIAEYFIKKDRHVAFISLLQGLSCLLKKDEILVIDNVTNLAEIEQIVQLPCHVLLTTRLSCESVNQESYAKYSFPLLKENECITMFYQYYNDGKNKVMTLEEHEAVIDIVKRVEYHTLTIELLAKTCAKSCINSCEMLERLKKYGFSLGGIKEKITRNNDDTKMLFLEFMQKLFDITDILSLKGVKPLLKQLSVLRLDGMNSRYLKEILQLTDLNMLNELADYGWIRIQDEQVFMHNVVSQIVNIRLRPTYRDLKGILKTLAVLLDNKNNEIKVSETYVEQSVTVLQYLKNCNRKIIYKIASRLGVILYYKGRWNESKVYLLMCLHGYEKCLFKNKLYLAEIYCNLGRTYKALAMYDEAIQNYNKSLLIRKKKLHEDDEAFVELYNNMAVVYYQWCSNNEKAIELLKKAEKINEKFSGTENELTAQTYNYLGLTYRALEDYQMAIYYFKEKALPIQRKLYGSEAYQAAETINNLAGVYRRQHEYDYALGLYKEALEIRKKIFNEMHPDLATSYNNIGLLYLDIKEWDKSMEYLNQALSIYEKTLGKNHTYTATVYHNIARVYMGKKNYSEAVRYEQMAVRVKEEKYTSSNSLLLSSYALLIQAYEKLGERTEVELYKNKMKKQNE